MMNDTFMKEKPVLPLILSMSLPMVLSMLVNSLYNIIDSFFVAQISEEAMTALSLVYPVQNFINAAGIGFGVGINAVIAFHLGAGDYTTRSFKDKRIVERPPEEWVIVENTHEPLVDQATFDTVQERIKIKQPATWTNTDNMFRGLMICGGCNTRMVFTTRKKSQIERSLQLQYAPALRRKRVFFALHRVGAGDGVAVG